MFVKLFTSLKFLNPLTFMFINTQRIACLFVLLSTLLATNIAVAIDPDSKSQSLDSPSTLGLNVKNFGANSEYDQVLNRTKRTLSEWKTPDLFVRMRRGFSLPGYDHHRVDGQLKWFVSHQKYLDRVIDRAAPYLHFIVQEAAKRGLPYEIALLPIVESAFQPYAYSAGEAGGIWQFIPGTAKRYKLEINWWVDDRRDTYASTIAAMNFLQYLHKRFDGDWLLALASYNTGQGNVRKAIRRNKKKGEPTDFWSLGLPKETRDYVPKLLAIASVINDPGAFGLKLRAIPDRAYFSRVSVDSQIDLGVAASLAEISVDEIYALNSGFNRWATPPNKSAHLLLPIGPASVFKENLALLDKRKRVNWGNHRVKRGQSLSAIANKYNTTVGLLVKVNKFSGNALRPGDHILVPLNERRIDEKSITASAQLKASHKGKHLRNNIEHLVQKGDTFYRIAKQYQVSVSDLTHWNSMSPEDMLIAGKKLVVRAKNWGQSVLSLSFVNKVNKSTTKKITYSVRRGDSLAAISEKFKVSVLELREWNTLDDQSKILPGQKLKVVVDLTKQGQDI